jgi:O-antigen/teichoic acid export membrane protein
VSGPGRSTIRHLLVEVRGISSRPALTVLGGSLAGQGVVLAASPLITRLYGPADLGALAVVTAVSAMVGAVAPLGYDRAVVVPRGETSARALVALALGGVTAVGLVATVAAWRWGPALARLTGAPVLAEFWWVCPVTIVVVALQRVVTSWLARRRDYRALARRTAWQGLGQVACNLALAPLGGSLGLVLGVAAGRSASLVGSLPGRRDRSRSRRPRPRRRAAGGGGARTRRLLVVRSVGVRYRRFPLVTTWSSLVNVAGQQAPLVLLASLHGAPAIGALALTMRVLGAPVGMVADAVGVQVEGQLGALARARHGGLSRSVTRLLVPLAGVAATGGVLCVVLAPPAFPVLFGERWGGSASTAVAVVPALVAQMIASPLSRVLPMLERQATQLAWDVARLVATTVAVVGTGATGAGVLESVVAWSAASVVSYGALLALVLRAARRADRHAAHGRSTASVHG